MRQIFKPRYNSSTAIFWLLFTGMAVTIGLGPPGSMQVRADPAFLAAGTTPNLLIIIDNSESMLDLAYMPDNGACHDKIEKDDREIRHEPKTPPTTGQPRTPDILHPMTGTPTIPPRPFSRSLPNRPSAPVPTVLHIPTPHMASKISVSSCTTAPLKSRPGGIC